MHLYKINVIHLYKIFTVSCYIYVVYLNKFYYCQCIVKTESHTELVSLLITVKERFARMLSTQTLLYEQDAIGILGHVWCVVHIYTCSRALK